MKLRKKILISISCMILGALILLLGVGGTVLRSFSKKYDPMPHQTVDKKVFQAEDLLEGWKDGSTDWEQLDQQLNRIDYRLYVVENDQILYSGEAKEQDRVLEDIMRVGWDPSSATVYSLGGVTVVGVMRQENVLIAQCMREQDRIHDIKERQMGSVLVTFLITGVIAIGVILLVGQIFTHFLAKSILKPVQALEAGAIRIQRGDLTVPIVYQGHDEFVTVCKTFNQMQEHLVKEQQRAAAYEKARTDMITGISHDLRTPLTSMRGYIKGIQDGVANSPEKMEQYLAIAYRKSGDMDVLLQKLFYFSKMETGKLLLNLERKDLAGFTERFAESVADELKQKQVSIQVHCSDGVHPVRMDEEQMHRVLANLLENALKYAKAEPLHLTLSVWRENDWEHLAFQDNGSGVTESQLPLLFDQFWRGDESRSSQNEKGSGLGLYIVRHIVQAHEGVVAATNEQGLKFDIMLPVEQV